jgi:hypothetical protein
LIGDYGRTESMADLTGKLNVELTRAGAGLDVRVTSSRPVSASRVFVGKSLAETSAGLPALFSVCAIAQACACSAACEAAMGVPERPLITYLRSSLVDAETVREHLWRMLLDWPRFIGEPPDAPAMARAMAAFNRLRGAHGQNAGLFRPGVAGIEPDRAAAREGLDELAEVTAQAILGATPDGWLAQNETADDLIAWARSADTSAARLLRDLMARGWCALGSSRIRPLPAIPFSDLEMLLGGDLADDFVARPVWQEAPAETSPYSRNRGDAVITGLSARFGNGLLPRYAAQLVEVAALQQRLRASLDTAESVAPFPAASTGLGVGIAQVQAARGLLIHRMEADGERVRDYRILAPTEWNFHPKGAVARGLAALEPADDATLSRQVGLLVTAVDPCVDYDVTIL